MLLKTLVLQQSEVKNRKFRLSGRRNCNAVNQYATPCLKNANEIEYYLIMFQSTRILLVLLLMTPVSLLLLSEFFLV